MDISFVPLHKVDRVALASCNANATMAAVASVAALLYYALSKKVRQLSKHKVMMSIVPKNIEVFTEFPIDLLKEKGKIYSFMLLSTLTWNLLFATHTLMGKINH